MEELKFSEDKKIKEIKEIKEIYYKEENKFKSELMYSISLDTLEENVITTVGENKKSSINKLSKEEINIKIERIFKIIGKWEESYISRNALDGVIYKIIVVFANGSMKKIIGRNSFPEDFSDFKKIISGE